ncbi:MAG: DivIVA domain-containing protein [Gemmatimonadota bacterium]
MIDLTPLDVRKKRGDFRKGMRGYDPQEVDNFLELVAERLEDLVRDNLQLRERMQSLERQVASQTDREEAVRDALVTAQELRTDIRETAQRDAEKVVEDARTEARRMIAEAEAEVRMRLRMAERQADKAVTTLGELERRRLRFLRSFRQMLEREMDVVEVEESRTPLEEQSFELELGQLRGEAEPTGRPESGRPEDDSAPHDAPPPTDGTSPIDVSDVAEPAPAGSEDAPEEGEPRTEQPGDGPEPLPLDAPRRAENLLLYLDEDDDEDRA